MKLQPLISVIIPIYNRVGYLPVAVSSIIKQKYDNIEIIIVDDGSTEDVSKTVKSLDIKYPSKIRFIRQKNKGPGSARNTGIKHSRGEFISFLDSDDEWMEGFLTQLSEKIFQGSYQWGDTATLRVVIDEKEEVVSQPLIHGEAINDSDNLYSLLLKEDIIGCPSKVIVKRECFDNVGLFNEKLRIREDWEMWLRLSKARYKFCRLLKPLYIYKVRQNSLTKTENLNGLRCTYSVLSDYSKDAFLIDKNNRVLYAEKMWDITRKIMRGSKKDYFLLLMSAYKSQIYNPSFKRVFSSFRNILGGGK